MDKVAFDFGFIQIYWYSLLVFIAMIVAAFLIMRESKKQGIGEDFIVNACFYSIIIGVIGARLYYVIFNFSYYSNHPLEVIQIWHGGLAIHGGIIAATIFLIRYCLKNYVKPMKVLDIAVVGLIIAQAIGRWGNFFNSEAYGIVATYDSLISKGIPKFIVDGMFIKGAYHHPTFFYESLWCFLGFYAMIMIRSKVKDLRVGQLTGFYLIWYGVERLIVEGLRMDSLMLGPLRIAQIISILFIIFGIVIIIKSFLLKDNLYQGESLLPPPPPEIIPEDGVYFIEE